MLWNIGQIQSIGHIFSIMEFNTIFPCKYFIICDVCIHKSKCWSVIFLYILYIYNDQHLYIYTYIIQKGYDFSYIFFFFCVNEDDMDMCILCINSILYTYKWYGSLHKCIIVYTISRMTNRTLIIYTHKYLRILDPERKNQLYHILYIYNIHI